MSQRHFFPSGSQRIVLVLWAVLCTLVPVLAPGAGAAEARKKLDLGAAVQAGFVDVEIRGKGSIESLAAKLTKKTKEDVTVVVPAGIYFVTETKGDGEAFWSEEAISVPFLGSATASASIPVVKSALAGGAPGEKTQFFVGTPANVKVPQLLDYMAKQSMSHEAKQVAVAVVNNPNLSRDYLDGTYYVQYNNGLAIGTREAVKADDPILAFMALEQAGLYVEDFKLYTEKVSLVHALGSQTAAVREYALRDLVRSGALAESSARGKDFTSALLEFAKDANISIRYRAVLGLEGKAGRQIVLALLPLILDRMVVYRRPGLFLGNSVSRTVHQAVVNNLTVCRETYEGDILPLLMSQDYKERLAGVEVLAGWGARG